MSEVPRSYSALSPSEQEALSVWIEGFDRGYECEGDAALTRAMGNAPAELRLALLAQLLAPLIEHDRRRLGTTPTLHELRLRHPDLAGDLAAAYPLLTAAYRLPHELHGYRVLRVVAEGGQAIVLRAQDDFHSAVAIKLSATAQHNELLLRERRLLGECQHPGVPVVIASGLVEERAYFVMPFLRGTTLADKFASHRPARVEAVRIAADLSQIVAHLHAQGILHRDVKPSNVWIDDQGSVKLIDLGMAVERQSWGAPLPAVQEFHGTPAFMSPEQASADATLDGALSDLFSLGATLFWMLAGVAPFGGGGPRDTLARAQRCDIEWALLSTAPRRLRMVCRRALASRPDNRFSSAAAFEEELRRLLIGWQRTATRWWAAVACLALLGAGLAVGLARYRGDAGEPMSPQSPSPLMAGDASEPPASFEADAEPVTDVQEPIEPAVLPLEPTLAPSLVDAEVDEPVAAPVPDLAPEANWVQETAAANGLVLSHVDGEDVSLAVRTPLRTMRPWGPDEYDPGRKALLEVSLDPKLEPIADALEFRIGARPWRALQPTGRRDQLSGVLSPADLATAGELEIRIGGLTLPVCAGPFQFRVALERQLQADEDRFRSQLVAEALTGTVFEHNGGDWQVSSAFAERYGAVIRDFRIAPYVTTPMISVFRPGDNRDFVQRARDVADLRKTFAAKAGTWQKINTLWVEIDFTDGRMSGTRRFRKVDPLAPQAAQAARAKLAARPPTASVGRYARCELFLPIFAEVHEALDQIEVGPSPETFLVAVPVIDDPDAQALRDQLNVQPPSRTNAVDPAGIIPYRLPAAYYSGTAQLAPIFVPPLWKTAYVRGRFKDGTFTNVYSVRNDYSCDGLALDPLSAMGKIYTFFEYGREIVDPSARPYHNFPARELELLRRTNWQFFAIVPFGSAHLDQVRYLSTFEWPTKVPLRLVLDVPYLDRYGRLYGEDKFCINTGRFHRVLAERAALQATGSAPVGEQRVDLATPQRR